MKRFRTNKINFYHIIIFILIFIIIGLCGILVFNKNQSRDTVYKYFEDSLINIQNDTSLSYQANLVNGDYLAILVTSSSGEKVGIEADVSFYNADNQKISSDNRINSMSSDGKALFTFSVPDLGSDFAGKIDVRLLTSEDTAGEMVDTSNIMYHESHSIDENNNTVFSIEGVNGTEFNIQNLIGNVVALKDGLIVCVDSFQVSDVGAGSAFNVVAHFPANTFNGVSQAMKYDEIFILSSYIDVE